jgi:hypothetical protein
MGDWPVPVRLEYATAQEWSEGGASDEYSYVRVKVRNLSPVKDVRLHYLAGSGWRDADLEWEDSKSPAFDVFAAARAPYANEFAISYSVGGATYWDNNGAQNYQVANFGSVIGGGVVLREVQLIYFNAYLTGLTGKLYVQNLSYAKNVGIRYSIDGGKTWLDSGGNYASLADEGAFNALGPVEQWNFSTPILNSADYIFAAYYNNLETGEWFWDNNFGENYEIAHQPEIE